MSKKVAIVTGGSRGIGKAACQVLAKEGMDVVVIANEGIKEARHVAENIRKLGGNSIAIQCDVSKKDTVDSMIKEVLANFNRVDVLVNNAGIVNSKPAVELSYEEWQRVIDVNLTGVFLVSQAVGKVMIQQGQGGVITNIASICGHVVSGPQRHCHYNASKSGVIMLSKSLAVEWAPYYIRVNCISPGYIQTDMLGNDLDIQAHWKKNTPQQTFGNPEHIADLIAYLASDKAEFVTGADWLIDGGYVS